MADFHIYDITVTTKVAVPAAPDGSPATFGTPANAAKPIREALTAAMAGSIANPVLVVATPTIVLGTGTPVDAP